MPALAIYRFRRISSGFPLGAAGSRLGLLWKALVPSFPTAVPSRVFLGKGLGRSSPWVRSSLTRFGMGLGRSPRADPSSLARFGKAFGRSLRVVPPSLAGGPHFFALG